MRRAAGLLSLLIVASACGSGTSMPPTPVVPPVAPTPTPAPSPVPPPPPQTGRVIAVGDTIADTLTEHGTERVYVLTAPADGTLMVRLTWEAHRGLLEIRIGSALFAASPPDWVPPVVARLAVVKGQTYLVRIIDGAPWDYDVLDLPFSAATAIE
jgi:hypothetical protein